MGNSLIGIISNDPPRRNRRKMHGPALRISLELGPERLPLALLRFG